MFVFGVFSWYAHMLSFCSPSLSFDESHTPTVTHMLFGVVNKLIVVVDHSTLCYCLNDLHCAWLYFSSLSSLLLWCLFLSCWHPPHCCLLCLSIFSSHHSSFPNTPLFPPMLSLLFTLTFLLPLPLSLSVSLSFHVLCSSQPVRVFYCSTSSSPSWLRLAL